MNGAYINWTICLSVSFFFPSIWADKRKRLYKAIWYIAALECRRGEFFFRLFISSALLLLHPALISVMLCVWMWSNPSSTEPRLHALRAHIPRRLSNKYPLVLPLRAVEMANSALPNRDSGEKCTNWALNGIESSIHMRVKMDGSPSFSCFSSFEHPHRWDIVGTSTVH